MSDDPKTLSIAQRKRSLEADAVLEQMFAHFTRDERPRLVVTDLDALKAA